MEVSEADAIRRVEMANGLRALADVIEKYGGDNWELPYGIEVSRNVAVSEYKRVGENYETVYDHDATLKALKKGMRGMGRGRKEKIFNDWLFAVKKDFGGGVTLKIEAARAAICKKVPTGNKTVHAARTEYIPQRVEEEFEWVCEDTSI